MSKIKELLKKEIKFFGKKLKIDLIFTNALEELIKHILDKQKSEIREMIEKNKITIPKLATMEFGDAKTNKVLNDILKQLK